MSCLAFCYFKLECLFSTDIVGCTQRRRVQTVNKCLLIRNNKMSPVSGAVHVVKKCYFIKSWCDYLSCLVFGLKNNFLILAKERFSSKIWVKCCDRVFRHISMPRAILIEKTRTDIDQFKRSKATFSIASNFHCTETSNSRLLIGQRINAFEDLKWKW